MALYNPGMRLPFRLLSLLALLGCGHPDPKGSEAPAETAPRAAFAVPQGLRHPTDGRDLIVVSIDTLRADRLPFYGGARDTGGDPEQAWSLSWLAAHGTLFESVWAPAGSTRPSFGTLWTGLAPTEHGAIGNKSPVTARTRAMDLEDEGWEGFGLVANYVLREESGLARGFRFFDVFAGNREQQIPSQSLTVGGGAIDKRRRLFLWAHFMAPHQPYAPPTELAARYTAAVGPKASTSYLHEVHEHPERFAPEEIERLRALYDAEILHAGQMVQELLTALDQRYQDAGRGRLLDNAVVVFVSDHGEELADRYGYFNHAKSLYAGVTRVPLLVLGRGWEEGRREPTPIGLADVLPMVLDGEAPAEGYRISTWHRRFYAVRDARWTLVHNPADDRHGPRRTATRRRLSLSGGGALRPRGRPRRTQRCRRRTSRSHPKHARCSAPLVPAAATRRRRRRRCPQ